MATGLVKAPNGKGWQNDATAGPLLGDISTPISVSSTVYTVAMYLKINDFTTNRSMINIRDIESLNSVIASLFLSSGSDLFEFLVRDRDCINCR